MINDDSTNLSICNLYLKSVFNGAYFSSSNAMIYFYNMTVRGEGWYSRFYFMFQSIILMDNTS